VCTNNSYYYHHRHIQTTFDQNLPKDTNYSKELLFQLEKPVVLSADQFDEVWPLYRGAISTRFEIRVYSRTELYKLSTGNVV